jgi:deoxyribodipyrimidine photolyase
MVKSNTPSRDMRALQRDLRKTKQELALTKRNTDTFKKIVFAARDMAIVKLLHQSNQKKTLKRENQILLQSLKNFNKACNKQQRHLLIQQKKIESFKRIAKKLYFQKKGLVETINKRNPQLIK